MKHFKKLTIPYFIWSLIIIVIPLLLIVLYAFTVGDNGVRMINFSFENFARFFDPTYVSVFLKSIRLGVITTALCLVLGYPMAYFISKTSERSQSLLILLVTIPMWINTLLRTYAWVNIMADNGIINNFLQMIGVDPIKMMYTDFSVLVGLVCDLLPFMIIPIYTSLSKMNHDYIEAAMDLGANRFQAFRKITFKLSIPGVLKVVIMVFLLSISTFVIPKLLGGGQYVLMGNLIEKEFISVGDWNFGSALSLILAIIILIAMRLMKKVDRSDRD
ncbi:MAG: ABC transporter permease [Lachnospiraceae bacterium]|nr:ABC transporter permease [Lachnospiraceae bacterium]